MINLILFLAIMFFLTFVIGKALEKIRIPWIFSSLLIGVILSAFAYFRSFSATPSFILLSNLGMYFLLFIIGFELDVKNIFNNNGFVVRTTIAIIFVETFLGTLLVHYLFHTAWLISLLVASSFSTIGEAVLLPILDEFKLVKTKLGQTILGVGVLDDVMEIITIIVASVIISRSYGTESVNIWINFLILSSLFLLVFILVKIHTRIQKKLHSFRFNDIPSFFLFILFFIFLFVGVGRYVESGALGAILAGIALKNIVPKERLDFIDSEIRTLSYGLFAPIFFLAVGLDTDIFYLLRFPLLVLAVMLMTKLSKIVTSYFMGRKVLGVKKAIIMGISLCVKFSTSIVVIKLLFDNHIITKELYSVIIGTTIAFKFVIPPLLSYFITKWKLGFSKFSA